MLVNDWIHNNSYLTMKYPDLYPLVPFLPNCYIAETLARDRSIQGVAVSRVSAGLRLSPGRLLVVDGRGAAVCVRQRRCAVDVSFHSRVVFSIMWFM